MKKFFKVIKVFFVITLNMSMSSLFAMECQQLSQQNARVICEQYAQSLNFGQCPEIREKNQIPLCQIIQKAKRGDCLSFKEEENPLAEAELATKECLGLSSFFSTPLKIAQDLPSCGESQLCLTFLQALFTPLSQSCENVSKELLPVCVGLRQSLGLNPEKLKEDFKKDFHWDPQDLVKDLEKESCPPPTLSSPSPSLVDLGQELFDHFKDNSHSPLNNSKESNKKFLLFSKQTDLGKKIQKLTQKIADEVKLYHETLTVTHLDMGLLSSNFPGQKAVNKLDRVYPEFLQILKGMIEGEYLLSQVKQTAFQAAKNFELDGNLGNEQSVFYQYLSEKIVTQLKKQRQLQLNLQEKRERLQENFEARNLHEIDERE